MPEVQWNLAKKISQLLQEYGQEVHGAIDEALPVVGKETVTYLREHSPERSGQYERGWKTEIRKDRLDYQILYVFNAKKPHITHLLEFGHAKRGGGRVEAQPHIFDGEYEGGAYGYSLDKLEEELIKRINNI